MGNLARYGTVASILVVLATGCGGDGSDSPGTTSAAGGVTTEASTPTPPSTTAPSDTAPTSMATSTTETTTGGATTVTAATTTTGVPLPDRIIAIAGTDLVSIDPGSGQVTETFEEFFVGDGTFRSGLRLTADGTTLYYSEGYEDFWYSCEASRGFVGRFRLDGGEPEQVSPGVFPALSPDERYLARVDSTLCIPDPENPDLWVLTPFNTVVVTHLESGETTTHAIGAEPQTPDEPEALQWVGWHPSGDLLALDYSGSVYRFPPGTTEPIETHTTMPFTVDGEPLEIVGNSIVVVEYSEDFSSRTLYAIDLGSGQRTELLATSDRVSVGIDGTGRMVLAVTPQDLTETAASSLVFESGEEIPLEVEILDLDW